MDVPDRVLRMKRDLIWREARVERRERDERARALREDRRRGVRRVAGAGRRIEPVTPDEDVRLGREAPRGRPFAAGIRSVQSTPANALVNNKSLDGYGAAQSEQSIAMTGNLGLAAWNNGQGFYNHSDSQGVAWTSDGGATWNPIPIPHPSGAQVWYWFSDPVVSVNEKTGEFFYCGLTQYNGSTNGVAIARGHFSGGTFAWDGVVPVRNGPNSTVFFDKPWMAADSSNDHLYLTYTVFGLAADTIVFSRSTDGGLTWNNPLVLNTTGFGNVTGSRPAVGPNGEVYVAWQEAAPTYDYMRFRRSTNGGASFAGQTTAATEFTNYGSGGPGFNRNRGITFPGIAVDRSTGPHRGRISLIWNESLNFYDDTFAATPRKAEVEPNDPFAAATPFTPGQHLEGYFTYKDVDAWSFSATQGVTYQFYVDSLTSSLNYTLRVYCGSDTATRLAFAGDPDSCAGCSRGGLALIVWTAPTTGTYYVRMTQTGSTGRYSMRTNAATNSGEIGRDQRDIVTTWSDDGVSWSPSTRVNDDPPWYDNWLPEIGVSSEGYPYAMWFDWRDALSTCGGSSSVYVSRSMDGGASWASGQAVTDTLTRWTVVPSNIAPNQGDYNGFSGSDVAAFAWADGRRGDPDVFSARLSLIASVAGPPGVTWGVGTTHTLSFGITQPNLLFANPYTYTLTSERNWPGLPASGSAGTFPTGTAPLDVPVTIPDSAAAGDNQLCLRLTQPNGVVLDSACATITVSQVAGIASEPGTGLELRGAWPNPASQHFSVSFTLASAAPASLELIDLAGRRVVSRAVGSLGPGAHVLDLTRESAALHPGVYSIRLRQGGATSTGKVTIVR